MLRKKYLQCNVLCYSDNESALLEMNGNNVFCEYILDISSIIAIKRNSHDEFNPDFNTAGIYIQNEFFKTDFNFDELKDILIKKQFEL